MKQGPKYIGSRSSTIKQEARIRPDGTDEWYTTEDGYTFELGDCLYNYYDGNWVVIDDESYDGWFVCLYANGNGMQTLNSVRLSRFVP